MYSANQVFVITKAQDKDGKDLMGYNFTINIEKSRFVREKSKFPFNARFDAGINKWSGLLDIATDGGFVVKPSMDGTLKWMSLTEKLKRKNIELKIQILKIFGFPS